VEEPQRRVEFIADLASGSHGNVWFARLIGFGEDQSEKYAAIKV
jgi:hypothetical protein